ncbi:hypothetical protein [Pantoea agglomerans]|uniref:hypothetical protein n=1 Tax=Enterobacter agglomerans TaxID=549 RepID=UPI0032090C26
MGWERVYPLNDIERIKLKQARDIDFQEAESGKVNALKDYAELSFEEDLLKTIAISNGAPKNTIPNLSKNIYGKPLLTWLQEDA